MVLAGGRWVFAELFIDPACRRLRAFEILGVTGVQPAFTCARAIANYPVALRLPIAHAGFRLMFPRGDHPLSMIYRAYLIKLPGRTGVCRDHIALLHQALKFVRALALES